MGDNLHILIIGAGATGLFIAQGLKKAGISSTIYERYSEREYKARSGQWSMALHWSLPLIEKLLPPGVYSLLSTTYTNRWEEIDANIASQIPIVNGATGELLAQVPMSNPKRVVRGKLRNLLTAGIEINFEKRLTDLKVEGGSVVAVFNDVELSARGSLVIGADGARSAVRDHLVPSGAGVLDETPTTCISIFRSFPREQALFVRERIHPIAQLLPHPKLSSFLFATVVDIVDPQKPETWVFQISVSVWGKDPVPSLKRRGYRYWGRICPWDNLDGRATLAGDAAHPMTPHRAQGLNSAIQDAETLVDIITKTVQEDQDLKSALDSYGQSTYERGKTDIDLSLKQMYSYHHWDTLMEGPLMKSGYKKTTQ
ncbi:hypothetical protein N7468_004436 [Penicillium chermesinum]|uniref:FAD-binding domain-containing protein n=1 Tax=Penicillium chermesinum TaxID=63820 RepID=A0A9W9PBE8_9EURO|nr:uncharacterized protein N7468_004436 [Penicillium chermesinum]KAJ5239817.1 hypothetical protein N7468_004436 [Penicillium chermesinum]